MDRFVSSCSGALVVAAALFLSPSVANAGHRYGGVWQEGVASGAFVPFEAGFTYSHLQSYRTEWDDLRITDFELSDNVCPLDETGLVASNWEAGFWDDELVQYETLEAFELGLVHMCAQGMILQDFETWGWSCHGDDKRIVGLFREADCDPSSPPYVTRSELFAFDGVVDAVNAQGVMVLDQEVIQSALGQTQVIAVLAPGEELQRFETLGREEFEAQMKLLEGSYVLDDMESFRLDEERMVSGLWTLEAATDNHEVGEVYGLFDRLLYQDWSIRRLADFEAYPDTTDRRFQEAVSQHLDGDQAHAFTVMQAGHVVAEGADGRAVRYYDSPNNTTTWMSPDIRGASASVTKFVTALGVLRFAEHVGPQHDFLHKPIVDFLPEDFEDFGAGVDEVLIEDLLTQRTGLAPFPEEGELTKRQRLVAWLQQPADVGGKVFVYRNEHSELMALMMGEVILDAFNLAAFPDPWGQWVNAQVLAPEGIGARKCHWQQGDALSYPFNGSSNTPGRKVSPGPNSCVGFGDGGAMFWLSSRDMATLADAARREGYFAQPQYASMFGEGAGLEQLPGAESYDPLGNPLTGERWHYKAGRLGICIGEQATGVQEPGGTDTLVMLFDDDNPDNLTCFPNSVCAFQERYELGSQELTVGMAVHAAAVEHASCTGRACKFEGCVRKYPVLEHIMLAAFFEPEDW